MAALNFPNSPSVNDIHTENGVSFKWNGTIWKKVGASYLDTTNLNVTGIGTFAGAVNIGGVLTYEDVKNVDSVGIVTARAGIKLTQTQSKINLNTSDGSDNKYLSIGGGGDASQSRGAGITLYGNEVSSQEGRLQILAGNSGNANGVIQMHTGGAERLRITSSGQVSISSDGTADGLLTIKGASDQVSTPSIRLLCGSDTREVSITNTSGDFVASVHGNDNAIHGHIKMFESGIFDINNGGATGSNVMRLRIDSSGRVLIGSTAKAGDSALQVYTADRKHPAIRTNSPNANGYTLLADAYKTDESQVNIGVSYSSSSLVLGFGCKVSDSADNAYLSTQDTYSTRPCALRIGTEGALSFWTTETNSTRTTDSAASLTEVFSIDRVGNIRQKISSRYMYFGANQELQVGVNGSDPYVNAASGDLQIRDAGNAIANVRSDGLQMYQDIYFATAGKGIVLGATSNVDANTLDDYEEGDLSWQLRKSGAQGQGSNNGSVVKYTKVGRMVCISGKIRTDSTGSNSNDNFFIDGTLPFAASTNGTAVIGHFRSQDDTSGTLTASIAWMAGSSTVYVYTCVTKSDYTANENNVGVSNQTNLVMTFSFTYQAS